MGNPGKPGKRLRLEDLQSQFGVGLKEAAYRLGICPTTLKVSTSANHDVSITCSASWVASGSGSQHVPEG